MEGLVSIVLMYAVWANISVILLAMKTKTLFDL